MPSDDTLPDASGSAPTAGRIGIGGPVGSGKTSLIESMLPHLHALGVRVGVITNDLVTAEDADRVRTSGLIQPDLVLAVEAGACPHTVIREDPSLNIAAGDRLEATNPDLDLILYESGGDNLASTFSRDLVDAWIFVIDVAGGGDIPRKRGPGVIRSDLLVINKTDLGQHVSVDVEQMAQEAREVRDGRPVMLTNRADEASVRNVVLWTLEAALINLPDVSRSADAS